jgi:DNA-binding transcriptional regulator YbjK
MADEKEKLTDQETGDVSPEVDESKDGDVNNKDAELDKLIQSKVDKTAAKLKQQYEQKISKLESQLEEEKTAKMSEAERLEHLNTQHEEERKKFERERLEFELSKRVVSAELPSDFTELWLNPPTNKEELDDKLNQALSLFETYKAKVLKDFRGENSRNPTGQKGAGVDFSKMGIDELTKYARTSDKAEAAVADYLNKR